MAEQDTVELEELEIPRLKKEVTDATAAQEELKKARDIAEKETTDKELA